MSHFGSQQAERVLADVLYINMSLGANARKLTSDWIIHHRSCFHSRIAIIDHVIF